MFGESDLIKTLIRFAQTFLTNLLKLKNINLPMKNSYCDHKNFVYSTNQDIRKYTISFGRKS